MDWMSTSALVKVMPVTVFKIEYNCQYDFIFQQFDMYLKK